MSLQEITPSKSFAPPPPKAALPAFDLYVHGSCSFEDYPNQAVILYHVDETGLWFRSKRTPSPGDKLKIAVRGFEDFDARTVRFLDDGFVALPTSTFEIKSLVAEVAKAPRSQAPETERRHARVVPEQMTCVVRFADGKSVTAAVLDISVSGAAIASPLRPELKSAVLLGKMKATVVRHIPTGFAVEFENMLSQVSAEMRTI